MFGHQYIIAQLVVLVDVVGGLGGIGAVVFGVFNDSLVLIVIGEQAGVFVVVDTLDTVFIVPVDPTAVGGALVIDIGFCPPQLVAVGIITEVTATDGGWGMGLGTGVVVIPAVGGAFH